MALANFSWERKTPMSFVDAAKGGAREHPAVRIGLIGMVAAGIVVPLVWGAAHGVSHHDFTVLGTLWAFAGPALGAIVAYFFVRPVAVESNGTSSLEVEQTARVPRFRKAGHAHWRDYVIGAGLAFDPLPVRRPMYSRDAKTALAADLLRLAQDRDRVLQRVGPFRAEPSVVSGRPLRDGGGVARGKLPRVGDVGA